MFHDFIQPQIIRSNTEIVVNFILIYRIDIKINFNLKFVYGYGINRKIMFIVKVAICV